MSRKLFLPGVLILLLWLTSCNKGFNNVHGDPNAAIKTTVFKASAVTPMRIQILVSRPQSGTTVQDVQAVNLDGATSPYTFTTSLVQSGDNINILVTTTKTQPLTASLTIDGVDMPATSVGIDGSNNLNYMLWNTVVK